MDNASFWRSLEMTLTNFKVELKRKWTKHCVLSGTGGENTNVNCKNIIFTIKYKKLYVSVVTLLAKDNQKQSKLTSKGFPRKCNDLIKDGKL